MVSILRSNNHNGFPVCYAFVFSSLSLSLYPSLSIVGYISLCFMLYSFQVIDHERNGETLVIGLMLRRYGVYIFHIYV